MFVVLVLFQSQLRFALDAAHAFETRVGLALVPSAIILGVVFLLYWVTRRHDANLRAAVTDSVTEERRTRTTELDSLTAFGLSLSRASDMDVVRDLAQDRLLRFSGGRPCWAVVRAKGTWESIVGGVEEARERVPPEVEQLADDALTRLEGAADAPEGVEWDGRIYFPLVAGETTAGVLALQSAGPDRDGQDGQDPAWRRTMASAAVLVAASVRNVRLAREVEENGVYDGLTGCFNRTHSMRVLQSELQRARRQKAPLALIMLDLDHFKAVNDTHGHLCGDAVLAAVGQRIRDILRNTDTKCRYGGEEFMVLLPDTPRPGAVQVADSLRQQIGDLHVAWKGGEVSIAASVGLTMAQPQEVDPFTIIGRADSALYRAKHSGRNRMCEAELPESAEAE